MLSERTYTARAKSYQWGLTKGEKKQIVVSFEIIGEGEGMGQSVPWFGLFDTNTWERTLEGLRYCGWKGDDLNQLGDLDQVVEIVVEHNTWESKTHARVAWVNQPGGGVVKLNSPMGDKDVIGFAAQMKAKAAQVKEVDGAKHNKGAASASANGTSAGSTEPPPVGDGSGGSVDDDLPFAICAMVDSFVHQPGNKACR